VRTAHAAEIQLARGRIKVEVSDISVGGARIRCDDWLEPGEQVSLLVPGLDAIPAAVRWQAEGSAGIAFHKPASIHALMAWLGGAGMALAAAPATGTNPPQLEPVAVTELRRDPLTGLHDRQGFLDKLEETLLRRGNSRSMVLAVIDIDGFKALNDVNGHETGDAVLVEAGRRLATAAGDQALLARLGSDEFALLLSCAKGVEDALSIVRSAFTEAFCTPSGSHAVSACIGTAAFPRDAKSGEQLICRADIALGAAKQAGGNRVEHFAREMLDSLSRKALVRDTFAKGLRAGEFRVHYEPIVPLAGDCGIKMEALFRWEHPEHGLLKAAQFSSVFKEEMLSAQVGRFVLDEVIAQLGLWRASGVPISAVTVNATLADFRSPQYVDSILVAISDGRISCKEICVEITEDVLLDDAMRCARHEMERLHQAGVCLIFDDFGTGYASLRHLRDMPICAVKIDRSFINGIATNEVDRGLVESIVGIAHLLGRVVVAEGVETPEQAELLRAMNCDMIQGYLVAGALPAAAAAAMASQIAGRRDAK
jgi:diguanylate cyclase (GGDEF)-like protein